MDVRALQFTLLSASAAEAACVSLEGLSLGPAQGTRLRVAVAAGGSALFSGTAESSSHVDMSLGTFVSGSAPAATEAGEPLHYYLAQCTVACAGGQLPQAPQLAPPLLAALGGGSPPEAGAGSAPPPPSASWPPAAVALAMRSVLCAEPAAAFQQANLWWCGGCAAGGATLGHVTGTHYDASHNLLLLLRGCKRVLLLPPEAAQHLGEAPLSHATPNHASAALWRLPPTAAPAPGGAQQQQASIAQATPALPPHLAPLALHATLAPGQALHIPEGWWHSVLSAPGSLAVNCWFSGGRGSSRLLAAAGGAAAAAGWPSSQRYHQRMQLLALGAAERARAVQAMLQQAAAAAAAAQAVAAAPVDSQGLAALLLSQSLPWAAREAALCAASQQPGAALAALLAVARGGPAGGGRGALQGLLQQLSPLAVEALQAGWEGEEEGLGEEGEGEGEGAAQQRRRDFQELWGAAFEGQEAAAQWLADARQHAMGAAIRAVLRAARGGVPGEAEMDNL